ncbi:uncharacterized protein CDV56_106039 [Aspergillus thermomutatus]|uniref:Oxidoreductase acuF-like C2H2 type zinc-finger domain-containing protein n=1 Tax=Aspergillus thermomutatus TaxID=41047 RepID=A0A397GWZ6_ASPTH|nr:uncharacterized protein CDV56_106039 [Aspergillus thermomutatus]RHZ55167.1 hypothetical protein CDV56_106039 [Aspergillus thermomutatus]
MDGISRVLNQCLEDFTALTDSDALTQYVAEVSHQRWLDELGRLRVWSGNNGAHEVGQASLDYRLRDASHLKKETIKLLNRMLQVLQEVREVVDDGGEENIDIEFDDEGDGDGHDDDARATTDSMTEIQHLYQSLVDIINLLFQISMAIRRPADHDRLLNMKIENASFFEPWAQRHISHKYPHAESDIVNRLSTAITRQKAILKYRERHRAKLGKGPFEGIETDSTRLADAEAAEMTAGYDQLCFRETDSSSDGSRTSYTASLIMTLGAISVPNPPRESLGKKPFECSYCFYTIFIRHQEDWARHVFRDLMPYVCLSKDCIIPSRLYESRKQWFRHMLEVTFEGHIGRHLEELALFVLRQTDVGNDMHSEVASPAAPVIVGVDACDQSPGSDGIKPDLRTDRTHEEAGGVGQDTQSLKEPFHHEPATPYDIQESYRASAGEYSSSVMDTLTTDFAQMGTRFLSQGSGGLNSDIFESHDHHPASPW